MRKDELGSDELLPGLHQVICFRASKGTHKFRQPAKPLELTIRSSD